MDTKPSIQFQLTNPPLLQNLQKQGGVCQKGGGLLAGIGLISIFKIYDLFALFYVWGNEVVQTHDVVLVVSEAQCCSKLSKNKLVHPIR